MTGDGSSVDSGLPPIGVFLESNYELFTVMSVFAALTAYLSQLGNTEISKYGVVGSSMLFFITGLVAVKRVWKALDYFETVGIKSTVLWFGYTTLLFGILAILMSLLGIMAVTYPEGTALIFTSAFVATFGSGYIALASYLRNQSIQNKWSYPMKYSPHLASVLFLLGISGAVITGEFPRILASGPLERLGYMLGSIITHAAFLIPIAVVGKLGELATSWYSSVKK